MKYAIVGVLALFALAACGSQDSDSEDEHTFQGYEDAVEKARDVDEEVQEAQERRRKALEENDG